MTADPDDEALRWEGDADPSYAPAAKTPAVVEPVEPTPVIEPVETAPSAPSEPVQTGSTPAAIGSFLLVTYGILAGAYLIYTIGWLAPIVSHTRAANPDLLGEVMVRLAQALAIASPAIWYGAALLLTRGRRPVIRLLALLGGLLVLLPWPYLLLGV